jgi:hypothetical protein
LGPFSFGQSSGRPHPIDTRPLQVYHPSRKNLLLSPPQGAHEHPSPPPQAPSTNPTAVKPPLGK